MATTKTKSTNSKIKELKGIKSEKITDEQLEKVQTTVNEINKSQLEIGSIEVQKNQLVQHVGQLRVELSSLQVEFEKDYGTYDIDIATGTINYEDVKANS